tara:strand:+ start:432 stop:1580 length:1149 start_codon:yes stop_codon:yes gene_type:complete
MKKVFLVLGFLMTFTIIAQDNNLPNKQNNENKEHLSQIKDDLRTNTYNLDMNEGDLEPASLTNIIQRHDVGNTSWKDPKRDQQGNIVYDDVLFEDKGKVKWQDYSNWSSREKQGMWTPMPMPYVSEDDVVWATRITRDIILNEPGNAPLLFPKEINYQDHSGIDNMKQLNEVLTGIDARKNLFQILKDAAYSGQVNVYNARLSRMYSYNEVIGNKDEKIRGALSYQMIEEVEIEDEDGGFIYEDVEVVNEVLPSQIKAYTIVEDWFFDKRRSKMDVRIVSLTPNAVLPGKPGLTELGTFYYPEIRRLLANHKVYNMSNMMDRMSFDEFFQRREFSSYIVKESNVYDRTINDYISGGDKLSQLWEGERIKENIRSMESSMWEY